MSHDISLKEMQREWHGTLKAYVIGFVLCVGLTGVAFYLATSDVLQGLQLIYTLITLAIAQSFVQVRFFLHLGQEAKPRWETVSFLFMVHFLLILAIGSLWIMHDLNQRMMPNMSEMMIHD